MKPGLFEPSPGVYRKVSTVMEAVMRSRLISFSKNHAVVLTETLLAAVYSFLYLSKSSLWFDEVRSVVITSSWVGLWNSVRLYEGNMWFYYVLLRIWRVFGQSEFVVRSLSAVCAVISVPFLYQLGTRFFNRQVGTIAGALLAVNTFLVLYAHDGRAYSLFVLLSILCTSSFLTLHESFSWRRASLYIFLSGLLVYTHLFGFLLLASHGLSLIFRRNKDFSIGKYALIAIGIFLESIPLLVLQPADKSNLDWVSPPKYEAVKSFFILMSGGSTFLLAAYIFLGFLSIGSLRKKITDWPYLVLIAWLGVPVAASIVFSLVLKPVFVFRYLIFCLPPLILLAAIGALEIKEKVPKYLVVGLLIAQSARTVFDYYPKLVMEDWAGAADFLVLNAKKAEPIIFFSYNMRQPFAYYLDKKKIPPDFFKIVELTSKPYPLGDGGRLPDPDPRVLRQLSANYDRVWVVLSHDWVKTLGRPEQTQQILRTLKPHYPSAELKKFIGVTVVLLDRNKVFDPAAPGQYLFKSKLHDVEGDTLM